MTLDSSSLGSFGDLATALGILEPGGGPNAAWFEDPMSGGGVSGNGLKTMMADTTQREALVRFVDDVLGQPDARTREGATWVPLFQNDDPTVTVYAVVESLGSEARLGVAFEHTTQGAAPVVSTRVHVPLFRFASRGTSLGTGETPWLLLGREGGEIELTVDATLRDDAPPAGDASLGGVAATVRVPTSTPSVGVELELRDLQLAGTTGLRTFTLDAATPEELGPDLIDLLGGLLRAQAEALASDPAYARFAGLAGMLGLRNVPDLTPFPIDQLPTRGLAAIVDWLRAIFDEENEEATDAWLGQVATLVGGTVDGARNAVTLTFGDLKVTIGIRVSDGSGGHPVLVPWVEASLRTQSGAPVVARATVDLFRADTGTGQCTAVPDARVEAVFGSSASKLIGTSTSTPRVDTLRVGLALDAEHRPTFVLTGHGVRLTGDASDPVIDVDLSSPQAALESVGNVLEEALDDLLDGLGEATAAVRLATGMDAPTGVSGLDASALLADPIGALRAYWGRLLANTAATGEVLGAVCRMMAGSDELITVGTGTAADPWSIELEAPLFLEAWLGDGVLHLDLALSTSTPVFDGFTSTNELGLGLATLAPAAGTVAFATGAHLRSSLARTDGSTARFGFADLALVFGRLGVELHWGRAFGLRPQLTAPGLALAMPTSHHPFALPVEDVPIPLPHLDDTGQLVLDAPDWAAVEKAVAALVGRLGVPHLSAVVDLLGWSGRGARLSLSDVLGGDLAGAVEAWIAELVLDCEHVAWALGPVAAMLSGFRLNQPLGTGNTGDPWRCPVAGESRAPGLRVWVDPGCAVSGREVRLDLGSITGAEPPETEALVAALRAAGELVPDVAELLVGRDSLHTGLEGLAARWAQTDGVVGSTTLPDGVSATIFEGHGYDTLLALGCEGAIVGGILPDEPAAVLASVVHVACEPASWLEGRPVGSAHDLTVAPTAQIPSTGTGPWFLRIPTPAEAAAVRPDLGAVGAQAAFIEAALGVRSTDVVLVGYGAAGAAAVLAANARSSVKHVVTVGAPWGPVSTDALASGLSGDALRLLSRLHRPEAERLPDLQAAYESTPLQRMRGIVARSVEHRDAGTLPDASAEPRTGDFEVHPVFGSLDEAEIARGLGEFCADGVSARLEARIAPSPGAVTAVHAGLDLPVLDLNLGGSGLLVGVGAAVELCRATRQPDGTGLEIGFVRGFTLDVHFGVVDGWLVGGPGSTTGAGDLRWMSARVDVPLDGTSGTAELVLHEATGLGIDRERWVVRIDPAAPSVDAVVPEVRGLLSDVMLRLTAAEPRLGVIFGLLGLRRDGGLDPAGLDRLLHDTVATVRSRVALAPAALAAELRALVTGGIGSGSEMGWTVGPVEITVDLATGEVNASLMLEDDSLELELELELEASATWARVELSVGTIDPVLGGVRLVAATPPAGQSSPTVSVELGVPGRPLRTMSLWPAPDVPAVTELVALCVPALGMQGLARAVLAHASETARPVVEEVLDLLGMLEDTGTELHRLRLPVAALAAPAAWLTACARARSANAAATAVSLLDALATLVVPDRGSAPGWPIVEGVTVGYVAVGDELRLTLLLDIDLDLGGTGVATSLEVGALVGTGAPPQPVVELSVAIEDVGVQLTLDPGLRVSLLRAAPSAPLPIYPEGPGLGDIVGTAAESLVPVLLNEVTEMTGGYKADVAALVAAVGDAMELRGGGQFTAARISAFAANPAAALQTHLTPLITQAAAAVVNALGSSAVGTLPVAPGSNAVTFTFGTPAQFTLGISDDGPLPELELACEWTIPDLGSVSVESLRLSSAGIDVTARLGPFAVDAGPCVLRPVATIRAGSAAGSARMVGIGFAVRDDVDEELSVEMRWTLDATPPALYAVDRTDTAVTVSAPNAAEAGMRLLSQGIALVGGVVVDALDELFDDHPQIEAVLEGVLFESGRTIDATFAVDLVDPDALLHRLQRLLWNATDAGLELTIDDTVTIGIASSSDTDDRMLGISVSLDQGKKFAFPTSGVKVELEVDSSWLLPEKDPGLSIYAVHAVRAGDEFTFEFEPGVTVAGVGVRFTNTAGPLLDLSVLSIDGIALHIYAEATATGLGGGVQLELAGFSFAPSGNGDNPVASGIMSDAGAQASPATRPAFSPAIAIQRHPEDDDVRVSVRAGQPPGPWWLMIQRQLGPLYVERVGFNSTESGGQVMSISLLFDGRVEIFGLTAAVDQLSITWDGGDVTDVASWSVDLMGLAISADMGGVVLAGGLLKTMVGSPANPGYVGMLLGRFGIYGLSVFGGYTSLGGDPSFFVFGAFNGPIGGPPAFFVTGIGGGLGINRKLVIPDDPRQFPQYPFIIALDPNAEIGDPMARLRELNDFFPPELGTFWFAGGISFTCFALVDGIAVIAVSFGKVGLEINLMGLARMALPRPQAALVSIELGLLARFSTAEGLFMIRAALTDNSWLLYPEVRLTGGFAFCVWWKGPLAGQFVLTIGGYHPDFHRDGYPDVPRLGLMWRVSDSIYVKGESFFALTSEALMAGVRVVAVADFGWAWARADFGAQGLVYFDPFYFCVEAWARVSAGIEIETFLGDISISITLGAGVRLEGPKFRGEVEVQVGPCTVTVPFGERQDKRTPKLDWDAFVAKYLEEAQPGVARVLTGITGKGTLPSATGGAQSVPTPDGSLERPYDVHAEFEITFTTVVPTSEFDLGPGADATVTVTRSDGASATLGLKPMGKGALASAVRLTLKQLSGTHWVDHPGLALMEPHRTLTSGSFPMGVWAAPDRDLNIAPALPTGDVINAGNQVRLEARAAMLVAGPEINYYTVEAGRRPLPLRQTTGLDRGAMVDLGDGFTLPTVAVPDDALAYAEARLFAAPNQTTVDGMLSKGVRSNVAFAGYRHDVAAPPLVGKLTDGLAIANGEDAAVEEQPVSEPAPPPDVREPRVVGYLTGGSKVDARQDRTTVTGATVKRRTAPTTASVAARLSRRFAVQLLVVAPPGAKVGKTFTPASLPFTSAVGSARSYGISAGPASDRVVGISGLSGVAPKGVRAGAAAGVAKAEGEARTLGSGDIVALHLPDHGADVDESRPTLDLHGSARLVCLRGDGTVLRDAVNTGAQDVPAGSELVVVQADGTLEPVDGLAGWHTRARVAAVGSGTGIAAGCVLDVEQPDVQRGVAWTTAGDLIRGALAVTTRFALPVTVVVVIVEVDDPERVGDLGLDLLGAVRAVAGGAPVEPALLMNGTQSIAVYPVVPQGDDVGVTVRVTAGGGWRVTGILGGTSSVTETVASLRRHGVVASTGRLLAVQGAGCRPEWVPAAEVKRAARKAATKKAVHEEGSHQEGSHQEGSHQETGRWPWPSVRGSSSCTPRSSRRSRPAPIGSPPSRCSAPRACPATTCRLRTWRPTCGCARRCTSYLLTRCSRRSRQPGARVPSEPGSRRS